MFRNETIYYVVFSISKHYKHCCPVIVINSLSYVLFWRTKNPPNYINILDTATSVVSLHSVHQAPSYQPILTLLARFLRVLVYLCVLFILNLLCTVGSAEHDKNKKTCAIKQILWQMVLVVWE